MQLPQLSPQDVASYAALVKAHQAPAAGATPHHTGPTPSISSSILLTCSFTPGSASLTAYQLTSAGFDWGVKCKEPLHNPSGYSASFAVRLPLLLSERFLGYYLVPDGVEWNYNFQGARWSAAMGYTLTLGVPREFYHPMHRSGHFLKFVSGGSSGVEDDDGADREDLYA